MKNKLTLVPDISVKNRYRVCGIHISPVFQVQIEKHPEPLKEHGDMRISMFFEMLSPYQQKNKSTYALHHYYLRIEDFVTVKPDITDMELTNVIEKKLNLLNSPSYSCQIKCTCKECAASGSNVTNSFIDSIKLIKYLYGYTPLGMSHGVAYSKTYEWYQLNQPEMDICLEPNIPEQIFVTSTDSENMKQVVKDIQKNNELI